MAVLAGDRAGDRVDLDEPIASVGEEGPFILIEAGQGSAGAGMSAARSGVGRPDGRSERVLVGRNAPARAGED